MHCTLVLGVNFGTHKRGSGRSRSGRLPPLKPTKVILFTMILYNSENNTSKPIPNKSLVMFELSHCSGYDAILSSIALSQQCCEVYFIHLTVAKPLWTWIPNLSKTAPPSVTDKGVRFSSWAKRFQVAEMAIGNDWRMFCRNEIPKAVLRQERQVKILMY